MMPFHDPLFCMNIKQSLKIVLYSFVVDLSGCLGVSKQSTTHSLEQTISLLWLEPLLVCMCVVQVSITRTSV